MFTFSYRHTWKSRHNHFLRYSDVRVKDDRRPTVNELANTTNVLQKINGWKIYHLRYAYFNHKRSKTKGMKLKILRDSPLINR